MWLRRLADWALETTLGLAALAALVAEDIGWLLGHRFDDTFDLSGLEITEEDIAKPDRGSPPPSRPGSNGVQKS